MAVCVLFGVVNTVEAKVIKQPNATYSNKIESKLGKSNDGLIKHRDRTPKGVFGVSARQIGNEYYENLNKNNKKVGNVTNKKGTALK